MRCGIFPEKIEQVFTLNVEAIRLLQNALDIFLDAYIENAENLIDNHQVRVIDGSQINRRSKE